MAPTLEVPPTTTEPTIFIVDDDPAFAGSISALIASMGLPSKSFLSAEAFLEQFDPLAAGCMILDIRMPQTSGLAFQEQLSKLPLHPAVIIMTGYAEVPTALRAMRQGAVDFLQKTAAEDDIRESIQRAIAHDAETRAAYFRKESLGRRLAQLTPPEREVLDQVLHGEANKIIAANLGVSRRTVEDRRSRVMQKLGVETLADLVRVSIEAGVYSA